MLREQEENSNGPAGTPNRYQTKQETLKDEAEVLSSVQDEEEAGDDDRGSDGGANSSGSKKKKRKKN